MPSPKRKAPSRRLNTTEVEARDEADESDTDESGPFRRCIVTRERGSKEDMIRFVLAPDGGIVPDLVSRLPGRGMWLSARRDVLEIAVGRNAFARAARCPVRVPPDLAAGVRAGLLGRISELLGLARRAGQAIAGFDKGRDWVRAKRVGLIVQARDGSIDERERFLSGANDVPMHSPLTAAALGKVFGRERVVHVVVAPGKLAAGLAMECKRLAGLSEPEDEIERNRDSTADK